MNEWKAAGDPLLHLFYLKVTGIQQNNYPIVQVLVLVMLVSYLIMSFVVDILYAVVDPRVEMK